MKQRMIAIYILLGVTAVMLASVTYAWYTISQAVTIELVEVSVSSTKNLEISSGRVSGDGKILLPPAEAELGDKGDESWGSVIMGLKGAVIEFPATTVTLEEGNDKTISLKTVQFNESGRTVGYVTPTLSEQWSTGSDGTDEETSIYGTYTVKENWGIERKVAAIYPVWLRSNVDLKDLAAVVSTDNLVVTRGGADGEQIYPVSDEEDPHDYEERIPHMLRVTPVAPINTGTDDVVFTKQIDLTANTAKLVYILVFFDGDPWVDEDGTHYEGLTASDVGSGLVVKGLQITFSSGALSDG